MNDNRHLNEGDRWRNHALQKGTLPVTKTNT